MAQQQSHELTDEGLQPLAAPPGDFSRGARSSIRRIGKNLLASPALAWAEGWLPPLRYLHRRVYEREFARVVPWARRFYGVYANIDEALRAAPAGKLVGYDNPAAASFMEPAGPLLPSDYPVLFWLAKCFQDSSRILDIGGYVGISYYTYRTYLAYPENLEWIIQDVPAVAASGVELARKQESRGLSFTTSITQNLKPQIVLAAGSLQFIEEDLADLLTRMAELPVHLIINKTPMTELPDFVTLQDLGPAVCAYRIFNRGKWIQSMEGLGYRLVDSWVNLDFSCRIPFHPTRAVPAYSGMYLTRQS